MNTDNSSRGFTLLELLVVIAIIGILSAIILASLNTARKQGLDSAIKSQLQQLRGQGELIYSNRNCYNDDNNGTCTGSFAQAFCPTTAAGAGTIFGNTKVNTLITAAGNASNNGGVAQGTCAQAANNGAWAVSVPLKTDATKSWCVDSLTASRQITGVIAGTVCP